MNHTLRQHRALRRVNAHLRQRKGFRVADPARKSVAEHWAESWPAVVAGLAVAICILCFSAEGVL